MEKLDLFDELEVNLTFTVEVRAIGRVVGLDSGDIADYVSYHAKKAAQKAVHELVNGKQPLSELGFS